MVDPSPIKATDVKKLNKITVNKGQHKYQYTVACWKP